MLGAVPLAVMGAADAKAYYVIPVVGAAATLAWLVDGRRYLGPGIVALALGWLSLHPETGASESTSWRSSSERLVQVCW